MASMRLIVSLLICLPTPAWAVQSEPGGLANLVLFLLFILSVFFLLSSAPRAFRPDAVSPEVLRRFALNKGLAEMAASMTEHAGNGSGEVRRWWSKNAAIKRPLPGTLLYRGQHSGFRFVIDETLASRLVGVRQRELLLRMSIELPDMPPTLEVAPANRWRRLVGRAGLLRSKSPSDTHGKLDATFSKRPVTRAKERLYLNDERRRLLEAFEAQSGGVHIGDGKLCVVRERLEVTASDLDRLYEEIGTLAKGLAARG